MDSMTIVQYRDGIWYLGRITISLPMTIVGCSHEHDSRTQKAFHRISSVRMVPNCLEITTIIDNGITKHIIVTS